MIYLVIGMVVDAFIGDPKKLYHPVIAIGKWIKWLESKLYHKEGIFQGALLVIGVLGAISVVYAGLYSLMQSLPFLKPIFSIYFFFAGLAYRSLIDAGEEIKLPLRKGDIDEARKKMGYYVSRDTQSLNQAQIIRTTIETLSENTIDGIIAPLFFGIIGEVVSGHGIWFMWLYKGINTMDSMVGYRNERYEKFGKVAARLDDVANFIPARIGAFIMLIGGMMAALDRKSGWKILWRDHKRSVSVNAGYPESVTAGLLGVQLGGAYPYFGKMKEKPIIGDSQKEVSIQMIDDCEWMIHYTFILLTCFTAFLVVAQACL